MFLIPASGFARFPVIKQIAQVFGLLMQGIFVVLSKANILSIAACITVFTIITKLLLLPLTIKQQKFTKVSAMMNPEIQEIQKKYEGRTDQASMERMRMEQQAVYDKYGSSMTAGCLPSLLQIVLLFGLYPVIYDFATYVPQIANYTEAEVTKMYTFLGMNLQQSPQLWTLSMLIPIISGALQFLTMKLSGAGQDSAMQNSSMKMMNYFMPLFSVYICFSLPAFLGFYWTVSSLVQIIQQFIINRSMKNVSVEDIIKENVEKRNKKREKQGLPPISDKATTNTRRINTPAEQAPRDNSEQVQKSTEYYNNRAGAAQGSLAAKANMVKEYNERNERGKK